MPHLQVRDVPDPVHRRLKARAALEGVTLSELVRRELERVAERPTMSEMIERISARPAVELSRGAGAEAVRAGRRDRDRQLDEALGVRQSDDER